MKLLPASIVAAAAGGLVAATVTLCREGLVAIGYLVSMTFFCFLIALVLAGLAGPPAARWIIGRAPVGWLSALLTGMAAATMPALLFLLMMIPLKAWREESFARDDAIVGLAMLAISGASAGLAFRAAYGARRIPPR